LSQLDDWVRKRKGHLTNCLQYLQTKLQQECPPQIYQLILDKIDLINDHSRKIDDILRLIERMPLLAGEPSVVSNLCASFYNQIFSRLQEIEAIIGVLDDIWSDYIAFENFSKRFSDLSHIFSKLSDEISVPLGPHFSMILPGNSFGYLLFPNVSRNLFRIFVPISAIENPYVWPIMAHEIGHAFSFFPAVEERIKAECGPLISQRLRSVRERTQRSREDFADIEYILSRSWYQWFSEIWADLFALRRVGPCFIDSEMLELMAFDPFSLSIESTGHLFTSSHPPPDLRIKMLVRYSTQWFSNMRNHVSTCQDLWNEMISNRTSPTLEEHRESFDLLCDSQLLQPMEHKAVDLLSQLIPLQEMPSSPFETAMNTRPINVTGALSSLLCEGRIHEHFVEEITKEIKLAT
jgi:hypothetical protein